VTPGPAHSHLLRALFDAAVMGAAPEPAVRTALDDIVVHGHRRIWLLGIGKAAGPMAHAAIASLTARGVAPFGGILVTTTHERPPHPAVLVFPGEHPVPGPGSLAAAEAIGAVADRAERGDLVLVLLSGGASSLAAAPIRDIHPRELAQLFAQLLGSGLDIVRTNIVRKRFLRWGAGRLAAALAAAAVECLAISDVPGDDLAAIGSGPCVPDPTTTPEVARILREARLLARIPETLCTYLSAVEQGERPETPKPGDPVFERVRCRIIVSNANALESAAAEARTRGLVARIVPEPLGGEAAERGAAIARALLERAGAGASDGSVELHGGETTVTLDADRSVGRAAEPSSVDQAGGASTSERSSSPVGGRSQELALSAARVLHEAGERADGIAILAAGTDGRDGPTDAAGAIVDRQTWRAIIDAGRDPARDLDAHGAYAALDAAGALLRTGETGTNVMDVVFGLRTTA